MIPAKPGTYKITRFNSSHIPSPLLLPMRLNNRVFYQLSSLLSTIPTQHSSMSHDEMHPHIVFTFTAFTLKKHEWCCVVMQLLRRLPFYSSSTPFLSNCLLRLLLLILWLWHTEVCLLSACVLSLKLQKSQIQLVQTDTEVVVVQWKCRSLVYRRTGASAFYLVYLR